ncbi:bestrophin family protein [Kingella kingae]|uniref:bestrophin family protein n=1 Tax=Kingella kingae TaxID=504 RepID=UPI0006666973|nr:bestrophin family protein [Kingella kingae]
MIVRDKRNGLTLLLAWRGTILPNILPSIIVLSSISLVLDQAAERAWFVLPEPPVLGFSIFGIVLSIFLGFRNNACYERWWEGRKQWGILIATQRHLVRDSHILPDDERELFLQQSILFTKLLRDRLRYQAANPDLFLQYDKLNARYKRIQSLGEHINPPQLVVENMQQQLIHNLRDGHLSDIVYAALTAHLEKLGSVQSNCERIASTPLPFSYSVMLHRTIYSFCVMLPFGLHSTLGIWSPVLVAWLVYLFLGLDALSAQLEEPFGKQANDLPLDFMTRMIEREILTTLNQPIPPALTVQDYVLS